MNLKNLILALAITPIALTTAACNTVDGAGEDLQSASQTVKDEI